MAALSTRQYGWLCLLLLLEGIAHSYACTEFVEIPKENYDWTYTFPNDATDTDRPLGFTKSTVVYQSSEDPPCYQVSGETGQYLEIKFETVPDMLLCVREKETNAVFCDNGRHTSCRRFEAATMSYELFCETGRGCAEADVNFWLRITKGPKPEEDTEAMWCHDLAEEYPEMLRPLPDNFTPPPADQEFIGGATIQRVSLSLSLTAILFSLFHSLKL